MIINSNLTGNNALRLLDGSDRVLRNSMEKLNSGLAINHTKDNAAGSAVVEVMSMQIQGNSQAVRNMNDGVSLAQTMDGGLQEVVDMFQRMRELGLQSLSGTYSDTDREQMDAEFQALYTESQRIAQTTKFNGQSLFSVDGTINIQSGWQGGVDNQIGVNTVDLLSSVGDVTVTIPGIPPTPATPDTLQFDAPSGFDSTLNLALVLPDRYTLNVAGNSIVVENNSLLTLTADADIYAANGYQANQLTASYINSNIAGYSATFNSGDGSFVLSADDGVTNVAPGDITWTVNSDALLSAPLSFSSSVIAGTPADPGTPDTVVTIPGATIDNIRTQADAAVAVQTIDLYFERFSSVQADLGSVQNRLEHSIGTVMNENEHMAAARSQIADVDYAFETARLLRAKALNEAGGLMLAHSNEIPQSVISSLLR